MTIALSPRGRSDHYSIGVTSRNNITLLYHSQGNLITIRPKRQFHCYGTAEGQHLLCPTQRYSLSKLTIHRWRCQVLPYLVYRHVNAIGRTASHSVRPVSTTQTVMVNQLWQLGKWSTKCAIYVDEYAAFGMNILGLVDFLIYHKQLSQSMVRAYIWDRLKYSAYNEHVWPR